jgi:hypothetical protein
MYRIASIRAIKPAIPQNDITYTPNSHQQIVKNANKVTNSRVTSPM